MQGKRFVVICNDIRSTHNVGSIFRTSDGAGVDRIYLCGITPVPPRSDINKVSLGAENFVPFEYRKSAKRLIKNLKQRGYTIVALENRIGKTIDYRRFKPTFPLALVVGSETIGIRDSVLSLADHSISIPMYGKKESLNVSVAFGIAIYQLTAHIV